MSVFSPGDLRRMALLLSTNTTFSPKIQAQPEAPTIAYETGTVSWIRKVMLLLSH